MAVESADFIPELNENAPLGTELKQEGDNHIRVTKNAVKGSFPNFAGVAVTGTEAEINSTVDNFKTDAPSDSVTYGRNNGAWVSVTTAGGVTIEDEGSTVTGGPHTTLNFTGDVTATNAGSGEVTIDVTAGAGTGDVTGPVTSTDTAIAKWNGTGGDTLADTGVLIDGNNNLYSYGTFIGVETGTSYTLTLTDNGTTKLFDNASAITVTLPDNLTENLPQGFQCTLVQWGVGQITVTPSASDVIRSLNSETKTEAIGAAVVVIKAESVTPVAWFLGGATTT